MNISRTLPLSAFAALALALVTGCSPKSNPGSTAPTGATGTTLHAVDPVQPYHFVTPASEQDLQGSSTYGFLIAKAAPTFNEDTFTHMGLAIKGKFTMNGYNYYKLYKSENVFQALQGLQVTKGILFAEPDQEVKLDGGITYSTPDPLAVSEEWSIYTTKLVDAWKQYGFGPNTPMVADLDTGINFAHEDMQLDAKTSVVKHAYSWWDLSKATPTEVVPTTTYAINPIDYISGTILDSKGAAIKATATYARDEDHGCHTAGTIAAVGNNGIGMAGVCWQANLSSYKVFLGTAADNWTIYGSLYHIVNTKVSTGYKGTIPVNMSLGGNGASNFAIEMVEACAANNVVIIASMGNSGQNMAQYPAGYAGVIAVGATNGQDKKVHFSTSGPNISVSAPGYDIISCDASGGYLSESGTSMSAPFVTGLVTYMLTWNPTLTPAQIKTYLEQNADMIEGATGYNEDTGWGRVNVLKTIGAVVADVNAGTTPASNYMSFPVHVTVQNTFNGTTTPLTSIPVYLYQTDPSGRIANFVASSVTSSDTLGDPLLAGPGVADFNLLRPGTYIARTNISGIEAYSKMFTVTTDAKAMNVTVQYTSSVYNIQTLPDAAASSQTTTDDMVLVYDYNTLKLLANVDVGSLDTATVMTAPNQALLINLQPYVSSKGTAYIGEYALWVGTNLYATATAPGTFAAPANGATGAGSAAHAYTSPQTILVNTLYNGNLTAATDWYKVVCP